MAEQDGPFYFAKCGTKMSKAEFDALVSIREEGQWNMLSANVAVALADMLEMPQLEPISEAKRKAKLWRAQKLHTVFLEETEALEKFFN